MKVLMIYPDYPLGTLPGTSRLGFYSEGIAALAASLRQQGHDVELLHMTAPLGQLSFEANVRQSQPDLVGFSVRTSNFSDIPTYVAWARRAAPKVPLVAGGCHATVEPRGTLTLGGFDYVLRGEADRSLVELCQVLSGNDTDLEQVGGLCWLKAGEFRSTPNDPLPKSMDSVPIPHFGIFDLDRLETQLVKTVPALLSRGCPFACTYCCNAAFRTLYPNPANYVRFRSPEDAIRYLKSALEVFRDAHYVSFFDDILPLYPDWFNEFMARYREEIGIPFSCNARADLLNPQVVATLRDSGCFRIHMGVESGDFELRRRVLKRPVSQEAILEGFDLARKSGMATLSYNMVGLPEETLKRTLKTIKLNARANPHRIVVSVFYPYPGTEGNRLARSLGYLSTDQPWSGNWMLHQPQFTRDEVAFASAYFRTFVRLYLLAWRLPKFLGRPAERLLDTLFLWPGKPNKILVRTAGIGTRLLDGAKRLMRKYLTGLYLYLRDRSLSVSPGGRDKDGLSED